MKHDHPMSGILDFVSTAVMPSPKVSIQPYREPSQLVRTMPAVEPTPVMDFSNDEMMITASAPKPATPWLKYFLYSLAGSVVAMLIFRGKKRLSNPTRKMRPSNTEIQRALDDETRTRRAYLDASDKAPKGKVTPATSRAMALWIAAGDRLTALAGGKPFASLLKAKDKASRKPKAVRGINLFLLRKKATKKLRKTTSSVQSVMVKKTRGRTLRKAKSIVIRLGRKVGKVDSTAHYWRFRQQSPGIFKDFRNIAVRGKKGVMYVIGILPKARKSPKKRGRK